MHQASFAEREHDLKRTTRPERFLSKMDGLMPWAELEARVEPFYPKAGRGRWQPRT
ncbi:MAG: hypothetical protein OXL38_17560 [Gammaproteobacteria bacterium]|nr:hypothetical protein [Gammaproteobacteria bacterium]